MYIFLSLYRFRWYNHHRVLHFEIEAGRTCFNYNMKIYLLLFTLVAVVCVTAEDYTTKYDNVDVDRILQNGRILTNYIKCMLDEGPCTNEGRELKSKYINLLLLSNDIAPL